MKYDRIIEINEGKIKDHLSEFLRDTVQETLNAALFNKVLDFKSSF